MNEPVWILSALFGFAILVQLLAYLYRTQQSLRSLQQELNASTQIMLDCSHKVEWFESRLEDLLDAAQLQSCDVSQEQKRLDQLIRTIKTEAMQRGYRLGLGELDLR
jgi:predicted Holliday junction resolvase-like endonuclease